MKIGVRFTAAIHTLLCIRYFQNEYRVTSDFIASSTGVHPVITRKILLQLQKAKLVKTAAGVGGSRLIKDADAVPLLDVYKAINESAANPKFSSAAEQKMSCRKKYPSRSRTRSGKCDRRDGTRTRQSNAFDFARDHSFEITIPLRKKASGYGVLIRRLQSALIPCVTTRQLR